MGDPHDGIIRIANGQMMSIEHKWAEAQRLATGINKGTNALGLRARTLLDARSIAQSAGMSIPGLDEWFSDVQAAQQRDLRVQRAIADVLTGRWGLRQSIQRPGDIDIMAPSGTNADEIAQGQFGWVLIAVGVAVVIGAVATLWFCWDSILDLKNRYKPLYDHADTLLTGNPSWEAKKREVEFSARPTAWESLEKAAGKIVGGAQTGLMIAIPIAALVLMSWLKPKSR